MPRAKPADGSRRSDDGGDATARGAKTRGKTLRGLTITGRGAGAVVDFGSSDGGDEKARGTFAGGRTLAAFEKAVVQVIVPNKKIKASANRE